MSRPPSVATDPRGYLLDGRWRVRPDINRIYDGDTAQQVPDKFMQVLVVLIENPGVVSRQELFDAVWTDTFVVDESLTRAISSLRKLLDDDPKNPRIIQTIPKKGYRMLAPVEPLQAEDDSLDTDLRPSIPPRRSLPWPTILAIALAVVSVSGWWFATRQSSRGPMETTRVQLTALPGVEEYPALSPAGDRLAFVWDGGDSEPDGVFVQVIGAGPPLRLTDIEGHYAHPTWSHDSRFIAYVRLTGSAPGIFMVPAAGGAEIELVSGEPGVRINTPTFSPDGRWLVFARRNLDGGQWDLHRKDLESGEIEAFAPSESIHHGGYRPRFSPAGDSLAFFRLDQGGRELVFAGLDGSPPLEIPIGDDPVSDFDWTPDGQALVVSRRGGLTLIRQDGSTRSILTAVGPIGVVSVADDGPTIAYSRGRREKNIWRWVPPSSQSDEERSRLIHTTAWDAFPALSPDGRILAFLSDRTGTTQLWLAASDGSGEHSLTDIDDIFWRPVSWSPTGESIALTVGHDGVPGIRIVEVSSGRTEALPPPDGGEMVSNWPQSGDSLLVSRPGPDGNEIWRRPLQPDSDADAMAVTKGGGFEAADAFDGSGLLFTRGVRAQEIWRSETDGSDPKVAFTLEGGEILTWKVTPDGLIVGYRKQVGDRTYRIASFDFGSQTTTELLEVPGRLGFDLDVDPTDGRTIVFDQTEAVDSDIFAVVNY